MRNFLLGTAAALSLAALAASPASAAVVVSASACVPLAFGTPCAPGGAIASGAATLFSLPVTSVGAFSISGGANDSTTPTSAVFDSQTIAITGTGAGGLIDIFFTITGVPTQQVPLLFTSSFTSNNQNADTHSVIESTYENDANVANALTNLLASATLTSAVLQTAGPINHTLTPGATVSITELYQIQLLGCGDQPTAQCNANLTIDLTAAQVPEPSGLALLGVGLLGLGFVANRKRCG